MLRDKAVRMNQNDFKSPGLDFHLPALVVFVCLCAASAFSQTTCAYGAKIQPALCAKLDSVQADQKLPIYLFLKEPVFHVPGCGDGTTPQTDSTQCALAKSDSEKVYWFAHVSSVESLFTKYPLYDRVDTNTRLDSMMAYKATNEYYVSATKSTILAMTAESLVASMDLIVSPNKSPCAATGKIESNLCSIFDTAQDNEKLPITIILVEPLFSVPGCDDRNAPPPDPRMCTATETDSETVYWTLHKTQVLQLFSTYSFFDTGNTNIRLDSSAFNFTRQYVVAATKQTILALAAEPLVAAIGSAITPQWTSVRRNNAIANYPLSSFRNNQILAALRSGKFNNATFAVFSLTGKNITAAVMKGNYFEKNGIVVVKLTENGRSYYLKELLAR
jgi:hypothetical protein